MLKTHSTPDPASAGRPAVDAALFREGMSRVAAAVHVVTTDGSAGRAGFTATAVTPVTDDPASLLVCVNASGRTAKALIANGVFCVNTLGIGDVPVADAFAGRANLQGQDRFALGTWGVLETGAPLLMSSLVAFDCRLDDARLVASHYVIVGRIVGVRLGEEQPALAHQGRLYHRI
ncbi:flavin reductase family protein [Microvirga sp. 17 mud 1-3]|uniref:flavin reductase family protein n=1 Tax=Microvirga sp. 17 mud 1-3 TaxID=2082949 RepID=UPI000D6CD9F1|nr:flavin reductase family protein [Microvirga sp. 17 mud 1-3]AWM87537.1 4-hydroxyphenylacetate 3-monooxygenase [Microvirga sp. 17 mud 1-3]